jgi:hypothetical protein
VVIWAGEAALRVDRQSSYNRDSVMSVGERRFKSVKWVWATVLLSVLSYAAVVYTWFDHDLGGRPPSFVPALSATILVVSLGFLAWLKGFPRPFDDKKDNRLVSFFVGMAILTRLPFLAGAYGLFSSDAAVQGVMALHIYEGRHHPVFLYRWSYVGSLKAHITALITWMSHEPVLSFAFAAILMYGAFAGASYVLARQILGRKESALAVSYVLFAPGFLTAWGMHNEGNYIDVLAFGTAMLVLGCRLLVESEGRLRRAFWLGLLGGLAFWAHILATYYLIAALAVIVMADWSRRILPRLAIFFGGFLLGDLPGILWNASHSWLSFRWWALDQNVEGDRVSRAAEQFKEVLTTSFAVLAGWWPSDHPPWPGGFWRPVLLIVFPAAVVVFVIRFRRALHALARRRLTPEAFLLFFALIVVGTFAQSSFGWMTEDPRYLLFLYSVVPIFLASALGTLTRRSKLTSILIAALLGYVNLHGSGVYWSRAAQSDGVNREFVAEVEDLGLRYGHTDYYISYKYNFLSHGRLVLTSALGPSQTEWYMPYREEVAQADRVALIPRSFRFARRIGRRLDARGITYARADLLYPVLFDFSEKIELQDIR